MERVEFVERVKLLSSAQSDDSFESFRVLDEYKTRDVNGFFQNCIDLLAPSVAIETQKLGLLFLSQALTQDMQMFGSVEGSVVNCLFESVLNLMNSSDLEFVHIVSNVTVRICWLKMNKDRSVQAIPELMKLIHDSQSDTFIYGAVGVLLGISKAIQLTAEDQNTVFTCVLSQFSKDLSTQTKVHCIDLLTECIHIMDETALDSVLKLIVAHTFHAGTLIPCFRFWDSLVCIAPDTCSHVNDLLMSGIVTIMSSNPDIESRRAIFVFLKDALDVSNDVNLKYIIPYIFDVLRQCDLSICLDDDNESNWREAHRCLNSLMKHEPAAILEPYMAESENPVIRLVTAYQYIKHDMPLHPRLISFIRQCLESDSQRIRYLAMRCSRMLVNQHEDMDLSDIVSATLKHMNDDQSEIVMEVHRILAVCGSELPSISPFLDVLMQHLASGNNYVVNSACNCMTWLVSTLNGDSLNSFMEYILRAYEMSFEQPAFWLQSILTTILQSAIFRLNTGYSPYVEKTLDLFLKTLNCGIPEIVLEAFTPFAILAARCDVNVEPLLPAFMELLFKIMCYFPQEPDVLQIASHTLYFIMEKCDVTEFIDPFIGYFCETFQKTQNFTCIVCLADIGTTDSGFLFTRYAILRDMLPTIHQLWKNQEPKIKGEVMDFLRVLITISDISETSKLISFAFELIDEVKTDITRNLLEYDPLLYLLVICAESLSFSFLTLYNARPWLSAFVTACLENQRLKDHATELLMIIQACATVQNIDED